MSRTLPEYVPGVLDISQCRVFHLRGLCCYSVSNLELIFALHGKHITSDSESMEQSPSWEADSSLTNQEVSFPWTRHLSLSWARSIQSTPSHPVSLRCILISYHLRLGRPSGLFPSGFPTTKPVCISLLHHTCYMAHPSSSAAIYSVLSVYWLFPLIAFYIYYNTFLIFIMSPVLLKFMFCQFLSSHMTYFQPFLVLFPNNQIQFPNVQNSLIAVLWILPFIFIFE